MAIDLKYLKAETIPQLKENIEEIAEASMNKQVVEIDTATISTTMTDPDAEKLRNVLLNLINNLKSS